MKILLIAAESAGVRLLRGLAQSGHQVVAVMASPEKPAVYGANVWRTAEQLGYATWPGRLVKHPDFARRVRSEKVDIILNLHSRYIIHQAVIDAAGIGSFNLHPGPLPAYAGLNTVSWALYRGETTFGVTVHKMVARVDAGPIVSQAFFNVEANETALSLYSKCVKAGVTLVFRLLETAATAPGAIALVPQDLTQRRYFGKAIPQHGRLMWSRPAQEIVNFVRACDYHPFPSPWGYPRATSGDQEIAIVKASLTGQDCAALPGTVGATEGSSGVYIACADQWICARKLMIDGQRVDAVDHLTHQNLLGDGRMPRPINPTPVTTSRLSPDR